MEDKAMTLKQTLLAYFRFYALMVKLVDAADSKSASERSVGSSPTRGTKFDMLIQLKDLSQESETQKNV